MVPALRICGDPTVRAACASAGASSATGPRLELGVGRRPRRSRSASPSTRTPASSGDPPDRDHRAPSGRRAVVDLDHQVGAARQHGASGSAASAASAVVERVGTMTGMAVTGSAAFNNLSMRGHEDT